MKTLRTYPLYEKIVFYTDNAEFHWLMNIDELCGRLMRWYLCHTVYDFEVRYKKGKANTEADAL